MNQPRTARSLDDLVAAGVLAPEAAAGLARVADRYAIAVTPYLLERIRDGGEPFARQYLPDPGETDAAPEERPDPIGDGAHMPVKGIVHRYPDRVLLKLHHACPVYCRFCFRREMVGPGGDALSKDELAAALDYVRAREEVWEVILTGGDPLALSARRLAEVVGVLDAIGHVGVIRLHSRVPLADPGRIDADLVSALRASDTAVWVAVHCNHPAELTAEAAAALARLADAGIPLLGQTVLLRGVNDDPAVLEALFRGLVRNRVKPYYLHHPDLAPGTARFRLDLEEGQALMRAIRGRLSGVCQPTYVLDIPGGHGKAPIGPVWLHGGSAQGDGIEVEDWRGRRHAYPPEATRVAIDRKDGLE
ncbi:lysine-2,3-aminomutase-like protein [Arenibaculum sp.]|uniref:lysine-2,3-aminomutase-like protein n=1 Tax=Arenibaculum sp. TaxID=2865862 RepID=UPI002E13D37A|nr:lysine-2,3-aminomutase-like protein [Arenibaculum sp.]